MTENRGTHEIVAPHLWVLSIGDVLIDSSSMWQSNAIAMPAKSRQLAKRGNPLRHLGLRVLRSHRQPVAMLNCRNMELPIRPAFGKLPGRSGRLLHSLCAGERADGWCHWLHQCRKMPLDLSTGRASGTRLPTRVARPESSKGVENGQKPHPSPCRTLGVPP
jgi:hypothetical protein